MVSKLLKLKCLSKLRDDATDPLLLFSFKRVLLLKITYRNEHVNFRSLKV